MTPGTDERLREARDHHGQAGSYELAPFQEAARQLLAQGETFSTWCERIGWIERDKADTTRLQRALGLVAPAGTVKRGVRYQGKPAKRCSYVTALTLCTAMELDPVEVGL